MERVIGIDLGTFNSCVAVVEGGTPVVIANRGGYKVTPSMVAVTEGGKRLVGHIAKRQAVTNAENTVFAAKRLIGRKWETPQVKNAIQTCPFHIVEGPHGDCRIKMRDKVYSIPEVSAMVLQEMKMVAEDYLGEEVNKVVVTVPAYFNDNQRQATKDAGAISGLDVIRIINEPTSAALAFGFGKNIDRTVAVFDLGGGTFDISILEISSSGVFKVISTAGDTFLGGEDFRPACHRLARRRVPARARYRPSTRSHGSSAAQRCRREGQVGAVGCDRNRGQPAFHHFERSQRGAPSAALAHARDLGELTADLVDRTIQICELTLGEAGLDKDEIEDIILVGGMTRMPKVQERVTKFFERDPCKGVHPDEVVGLGASIQGAALVDDSPELDMVLLDVTPHTLGIMVVGGYFEELIPQNTTVPTSRSKPFTTVRDNQTAVKILVLQGESRRAEDNELLGEFILTGLRRAPAGQVEVEVTFEINADGIVSVHAKDVETGKEQSITVTATSGLTEDEIDEMMADASDFAVSRREDEASEKVRQQAETLIAEIERLFPEVESIVAGSDFGRDAIDKARGVVDKARTCSSRGDIERLEEELESLGRTQRMFKGVVGKSA